MPTGPPSLLLVWGSNKDGQLGLTSPPAPSDPSTRDCLDLSEADLVLQVEEEDAADAPPPANCNLPTPLECLSSRSIAGVSCGSRHTLAFSADGAVFSWGWGACGQLGHKDLSSEVRPRQLEALKGYRVVAISAGGMHSAAIVEGGHVYTWGNSSYGQLGRGPTVMAVGILPEPGRVTTGPAAGEAGAQSFVGSAAGAATAAAAAGHQRRVSRHRDSVREQEAAQAAALLALGEAGAEVGAPLVVARVSCGGMHTAAITPEGAVYCWGRADSGQLGIGYAWVHETDESIMGMEWPQFCSALDGKCAVDVACGGFHTVIATDAGEVYTWGKEDYGVLGYSKQELLHGGLNVPHLVSLGRPRIQNDPESGQVVVASEKASMVGCGGWHTFMVTREGVPWACGRGEYGRLGMGNESSKSTPEALPLWQKQPLQPIPSRVTGLGLGGAHSLLLTEDGTVYSFGRAEEGRLGLQAHDSNQQMQVPAPMTTLRQWTDRGYRVAQVAGGGNHSAALLQRCDTATAS